MALIVQFLASQVHPSFLDIALKVTLVLVIAWGVSRAIRAMGGSAAARHLVWCLALVALLGWPLLATVLPTWVIAHWETSAGTIPSSSPLAMVSQTAGDEPAVENSLDEPSERSVFDRGDLESCAGDTDLRDPISLASSSPSLSSLLTRTEMQRATSRMGVRWGLIFWMTGWGVALAPMGLGLLSLGLLVRQSRRIRHGRLWDTLEQVVLELGIRQNVRLLQTGKRSMPMVWGMLRPTILLPAEADGWSEVHLRSVLIHELAHIQRRDCAWQYLALLTRAAYWFHPLVWLAARELRIEQEQACDDRVLITGFNAADYAEHLLRLASRSRFLMGAPTPALAIAKRSKMERRIRSILDPAQSRRSLSRRGLGLSAILGLMAIALLASFTVESTTRGVEPSNPQPAVVKVDGAPKVELKPAGDDRTASLAALQAKISDNYVKPVNEAEILQGALKGMVGALRDPYSDYLTPEMAAEFDRQVSGSLVGIGAQLEIRELQVRVVTALPNSPALAANIQPGDTILQVDGNPVAGLPLMDVVKKIQGPQGTPVRLKLGRGDQSVEVEVTRKPITLQTLKGFRQQASGQGDYMLDARRKIGYISVAQFGSATPQELTDVLESLRKQSMAGLILDLRFCPGGMLDAAVSSAKLFLNGGTIVSIHGRAGAPAILKADDRGVDDKFPLLVLINGGTASAAEIVAGALQDNRRAILLGSRTLGKGSVQSIIKLGEGSGALRLTTSTYQLPNGRNIEKGVGAQTWGIDPDPGYFVPLDRAQVKTMLERRQQREILGAKAAREPMPEVNANWIEHQQSDPQLAAALRALTARLETGEFAKASQLEPEQIEQYLKRESVEQRRESVLQSLEQLNRELADLDRDPAK